MKTLAKLLCIQTLIFFASYSQGQTLASSKVDSVKLLIDTALNFAKSRSIYKDKVNWQQIEDSVKFQASNAHSVKEAIPAIRTLFRLLGDHHAFMNYNAKYYRWRAPVKPIDTLAHQAVLTELKKNPYIKIQMLEKGYGYLMIPANNPTQPGEQDRIGQQIQDSLNKLQPEKLKGLIIDLRLNYGGAMFAMLGGIANLFEPGDLGKFTEADGISGDKWGVTRNKAYTGTHTYSTVAKMGKPAGKLKVAVVLSFKTASSGEAVAISFKGRQNTFFIGENTAGYTTSNDSFWIAYSTGVFISTGIEADRNGVLYKDFVQPDLKIIGGDNFDNLKEDKKVLAAVKHLKNL